MSSSSAAIGALVRVAGEMARAAIGALRPAHAGATKTYQVGDVVVDPVTGREGKVIHAATTHVQSRRPEE